MQGTRMIGWSAPFAKRVLKSWATRSKETDAAVIARRIKDNIKAKTRALTKKKSIKNSLDFHPR